MSRNKKTYKRRPAHHYWNEKAIKRVRIEEKCNWDNLPNEMKVMCIKRTDFKTRANLMLSNRHNKMLVESIKCKYPLSFVRFFAIHYERWEWGVFGMSVKSQKPMAAYVSDEYEPRKLMDVLLNANIDELVVEIRGRDPRELPGRLASALQKCDRKFTVKSLRIVWSHWDYAVYPILEHCDEHLEHISVTFVEKFCAYDVATFLSIPQVFAVSI